MKKRRVVARNFGVFWISFELATPAYEFAIIPICVEVYEICGFAFSSAQSGITFCTIVIPFMRRVPGAKGTGL